MRVRFEELDERSTGDWLVRASDSSACRSPSGTDSTTTASATTTACWCRSLDRLPVDPSTDVPSATPTTSAACRAASRARPTSSTRGPTSSLTPQLAGGWERDPELWNLVAPFNLRPQGQDIIRTWLFSTLLRSALADDRSPWSDAAISGFIVDPDRKKMSKSKGNVVTPADILVQHGSDAVRYWAASSRLGTDAAFDPQNPTQIKIGRRLAIKVLNAAKFVLSFPVPEGAEVTHALDASMLATLDGVVRDATRALEGYDHARALEIAESFFWTFCDDYLELVKERAYNQADVGQASAALALRIALETLLRLFAPVIAFAAEEAWSWFHDGSVHVAGWPEPLGIEGDPAVLTAVGEALVGVRRAKTEAKASQKTPVARVTIAAPPASIAALQLAEGDLKAVGRIAEIAYTDAEATAVAAIELAPVEV